MAADTESLINPNTASSTDDVKIEVAIAEGVPSKIHHIQHLEVDDVYIALATTTSGLNQRELIKRQEVYGKNRIEEPPKPHMIWNFLSHFTHLMAMLLWAAGILAIVGDSVSLGIAVWSINVLNGAFSFSQEFQASQAADALKKMLPSHARVIRDDQQVKVLAEELVPGDLIIFDEGDLVSADCRVVEGSDLMLDQSTFTGESVTRGKSPHAVPRIPEGQEAPQRTTYRNLIFSGTHVVAGHGKAIVIATGMNTEFGDIAKLTLSVEAAQSPLQKEMGEATVVISLIAVSVGLCFFFLSHFMGHVRMHHAIIFTIGMIVAFIPEGLLPLVTLSLARASLRMANRGAIVKRLSAVETLGCTSVICSDKTGTITLNQMSVTTIWLPGGVSLAVSGDGYDPTNGTVEPDKKKPHSPEHLKELFRVCCLCNNSEVMAPNVTESRYHILGNPTEGALLVAARKGGMIAVEESVQFERVDTKSFSSFRKRMSTIHNMGNDSFWLACKGAPDVVLDHCKSARYGDEVRDLTEDDRKEIMASVDALSSLGQRVLAMASRPITPAMVEAGFPEDEVESDLVFLGLCAMKDPPQDSIYDAVASCQGAGIRVVMITGDSGPTASSIARQIGMSPLNPDGELKVIVGNEINHITDEELDAILASERDMVFARTRPSDKQRVVRAFQRLGHVVAVTGDGVNDAPALKQAQIGVAMGKGGTDVAKQSSEIIITDNSFATIVLAIEEGRAVYDNIKKFLTYILASNTAEAIPFIFFVVSGGKIPLALPVIIVLAIDLGTDMIPALALGADPPAIDAMSRPPRDLEETFFKPFLLMRGLGWLGLMEGTCAMVAYYYHYWTHGSLGHFTGLPASGEVYTGAVAMAFAAVVWCQVGNVFACRSETSYSWSQRIFNNHLIWFGLLFEVAFLCVAIFIPGLHQVFGTSTLKLHEFFLCLLFVPVMLLWSDLHVFLSKCLNKGPFKIKEP